MQLQKQPNNWSCLATAFAMAFEMSLEELLIIIGHDGSEEIHPSLSEPYNRRSFHIQEMVDVAIKFDLGIVQIDLEPIHIIHDLTWSMGIDCERMRKYLEKFTGVLVGIGTTGRPHAVAWDGVDILDPNGQVYNIKHFDIESFFIITKINLTD